MLDKNDLSENNVNSAAISELGEIQNISDLCTAHYTSLHCSQTNKHPIKSAGVSAIMEESHGEGSYWYYPLDEEIAIVSFSLKVKDSFRLRSTAPSLFCFGSYGHDMVCYLKNPENLGDRALMGYGWKGPNGQWDLVANGCFNATSVTFFPKGLKRISSLCNTDPLILSQAIMALDGTRNIQGLHLVFDEMRRAKPSETTSC